MLLMMKLLRIRGMMIKRAGWFMVLALLCQAPYSLYAQIKDFQTWCAFNVSYKLTDRFDTGLELGQRFRDNSLRYDRSLVTLKANYDLTERITIAGGARYYIVQDNELQLNSRYRFNADVSYEYKWTDLALEIRQRFQYILDGFTKYSYYNENKATARTRALLHYHLFGTRFSFYSGIEMFSDIGDGDGTVFSMGRLMAGSKVTITPSLDFSLSYFMEQELNKTNPLQSHILLLDCAFKI